MSLSPNQSAQLERAAQLKRALQERILVIDGAMGTQIQANNLGPADFGGEAFEGCNEFLNITRPDVIRRIHEAYLAAGADIVETNTFGSTSLVLAEYPPLHERAYEITLAGARLAREACDAYSTPDRPRWVAGDMGPTTKAISVTGGITFPELVATFQGQAEALMDGGSDYLLLETAQDTRNIKAGLLGIRAAFESRGYEIPVAVSGTIEPMGTMLGGQTIEALVTALDQFDLLYVGLNCATGPAFMTDHIRAAAALAPFPVACVPNAGLPDENGHYLESPTMVASVLARFAEQGWLNVVGGCCGTTPAYIREIAASVEGKAPRRAPAEPRPALSGLEHLELDDPTARPFLVGERTNVIGSRKFKRLIIEGKIEEAAEIARAQVKGGAHIIDVCLANSDRDEQADVAAFMEQVIKKVKAPFMIDSTDAAVIETALSYCQGKAIINSVNLEDGEERFDHVVPIAKRYGAALVVGTIDERGMAVTRQQKLEVARRSHQILTEKWGLRAGDLVFDPLVFPCATGDENYLGSARETIEGIRLIKEALPGVRTILGISNVSFGLPPAGREVMNAVFLYHCVEAGLDMAIVNTEKLERYASIPAEERSLAEAVLFQPSDETIAAFAAHFRDAKPRERAPKESLPLDERLANYIIEGSKDGLLEDLALKMQEARPLEIINGPLMAGMDEVGRLFNKNELIVAEVLQSAEAMKAAVAYLEPHMEKAEVTVRGTILLATVKGDVHDIGKNLVEIILSNNGYRVINLGIKVPPQELIAAIREHKPDLVGLSGLLVKSAQQMVVTVEEFKAAGIDLPVLVGGAALTPNFTRNKIGPAYGGPVLYARDAMQGLEIANSLMNPERRAELLASLAGPDAPATAPAAPSIQVAERSPAVPVLTELPTPPDLERHVLKGIRPDEVWPYVNPVMLYGKHLGLRGGRADELLANGDPKAKELEAVIDQLKAEWRAEGAKLGAVYQFVRVYGEGNQLRLPDVGISLPFPRQTDKEALCLSDYAHPDPAAGDTACLFVVGAGQGIRERYEFYKNKGEYLKSHAIQALAIETAEAAAEWLHTKLRGMWGFPDDLNLSMRERFQAKYRGKRYSFGYPACPDLALQRPLFDLLKPEEIGVTLTEEFMMEPEASVSALVFHHPVAKYFGGVE